MVGSQIANLTPGPSFAHNLGCRCPNGQLRGQFRHLHFKTFPMAPRTPQCEVFWPFKSSSEFSGVPEDSKFPLLGVWASPSHLAQSGVATPLPLYSAASQGTAPIPCFSVVFNLGFTFKSFKELGVRHRALNLLNILSKNAYVTPLW